AAPVTRASLPADKKATLKLDAAYEGAWGNGLQSRVDHDLTPEADLEGRFNLTIRDRNTGLIESFRNLSVDAAEPRFVTTVLKNESKLVRVQGSPPAQRPGEHDDPDPDPAKGGLWGDGNAADPNDPNKPGSHSRAPDDAAKKASDGAALDEGDFTGPGTEAGNLGLYALQKADLFNLLCLPPYKAGGGNPNQDVDLSLIDTAAAFCKTRRAFLIIDPPSAWTDKEKALDGLANGDAGSPTNYAGLFFPRLRQANPLHDGQVETFAPCGAVAG